MANGLFQIGVSALAASQRGLATVSHNIANVNTDGYARQRVEFSARSPQGAGGVWTGNGVETSAITRTVDQFLQQQLRTSTSNHARVAVVRDFAAQVNNILGDPETGLSPALGEFFDGVQALVGDPASVPARQVLLASADTFVSRFHDQHLRLDETERGVDARLRSTIEEINAAAQGIADYNRDIVQARGRVQGTPPNDLLDQRDALLLRLSALTNVTVVEQEDGAINISVGRGQALVAGGVASTLSIAGDPLDATRLEVAYSVNGVQALISDDLTGGELGGLLSFRDEVLDPARNGLGRIAVAVSLAFNAQHRMGMDLDGAPGGDFFAAPSPRVLEDGGNTGTLSVAYDEATLGALTISDYDLRHDGANLILTRRADQSAQTLAGPGPFTVDGMTITLGAAPVAGDHWQLQPTRTAARDVGLAIGDVRDIAAASPVRSAAPLSNRGAATVSAPQVLDETDAALQTTVDLVFNDPPTTYQVNGVGPLLPYTSGADIDINGWRAQVTGSPQAADRFTISANTGAVGDNRNALALAALQGARLLDGGNATSLDAYGAVVSRVGSQARQAEVNEAALATLKTYAEGARAEVSGVNLDEEAANLIRFQQSYQAAAQIISSAQAAFDSLLRLLGG